MAINVLYNIMKRKNKFIVHTDLQTMNNELVKNKAISHKGRIYFTVLRHPSSSDYVHNVEVALFNLYCCRID